MRAAALVGGSIYLLGCLLGSSSARAEPLKSQRFKLYKFQREIGTEVTFDDGHELRFAFAFTDRTDTVPLAGLLERGKDGTPVRYQLWGNTSRFFGVDDRVVVERGNVAISQLGGSRSVAAPARFFVGSAYAPVSVLQDLLRYWASHGKPATLPVFPIGNVTIERRGEDTVTHRDGAPRRLERFAIGGLGWGKLAVWLDDKGDLAALKTVDTEFDHFEATGWGFEEALPVFVARAAEDGLAAFGEISSGLRVDGGDGPIAYVHARLIDGSGAPPVDDAVIVVDGDKIAAAGPRDKVRVPAGARTFDAAGNTVIPGLWDMHAHVEQVEWGPVYLAGGVTTVRDCGNELDFIRAMRDTIDAGTGVGPRILMACIVDGEGAGAVGIDRLRTADQIPALIKKFKAASCSQVKIYQRFDPKLIRPLANAAHAAGMTVTGHVPSGIGAVQAITDGFDHVNHIQFLLQAFAAPDLPPTEHGAALERAIAAFDPSTPAARKLAAWFAARRTVIDPTLALREISLPRAEVVAVEPGVATLPPQLAVMVSDRPASPQDAYRRTMIDKALALVGLLHRAGVPIVAGTDQAIPAHSLHRELELYVKAGFTPLEAIQAATLVPARAMKQDKDAGTIAAGKRADFLLLTGDPLADIRATRKIRVVVAAGKAYDPTRLWRAVGFTPPAP